MSRIEALDTVEHVDTKTAILDATVDICASRATRQ
jgi:hypothetical protein